MPRYSVQVEQTSTIWYTVTAASSDAARDAVEGHDGADDVDVEYDDESIHLIEVRSIVEIPE